MARFHSRFNVELIPAVGVLLTVLCGSASLFAGPPREMKLDMDFDAFNAEFDRQTERGFRLIDVSIYQVGPRDLYSGIWEERPEPKIALRHGLVRATLQEKTDELAKDRYGLVYLDGKGGGGREKFAGIWAPCDGLLPQVWVGMAPAEFNEKHAELEQQGCRITDLSTYELNGQILSAGLWNKGDDLPETAIDGNLTARQLLAAVRKKPLEGFRISRLSACIVNGQDRYTCLWKKTDGPAQEVRSLMSKSALTRISRQMETKGLQPVQVSAFAVRNVTKFTVVWEDNGDAK